MRSSNPALSGNVFQNIDFHADSTRMTITGTALKTLNRADAGLYDGWLHVH